LTVPDPIEDSSTFREVAIRLEGKIDALSAKLDGRLDAVMAKIEAGDRESVQLFKLQESELGHVTETVRANTTRISEVKSESEKRDLALENEIGVIRTEIATLATKQDVAEVGKATADFPTVKNVVYGLVALILTAVVLGLLGLVVIHP
jgi:hypothetical protein